MRKLTPSELRLALLFGGAIFVALNLFAIRSWMTARASLTAGTEAARSSLAEGRSWIEAAGALGSANEWIKANPPPDQTAETASSELLANTRSAAKNAGITVVEENLLPVPSTTAGAAAALQVKVSGRSQDVTRFLFELQAPARWRSVPRLTIRSDAQPPNVVVDMEVRQYYRPAAPSSSLPTGS